MSIILSIMISYELEFQTWLALCCVQLVYEHRLCEFCAFEEKNNEILAA